MIPKERRASVFFSVEKMQYLGSVVHMVATLSELCFLLPKSQILKLATITTEKNRQGIWRTYLVVKRANSVHLGYAVLDGFAGASTIPTKLLNVLERLAKFSMEPLHNMLDLVKSTIYRDKALKYKQNGKL